MQISQVDQMLLRLIARLAFLLLAVPSAAASQSVRSSCALIDGGGGIRVHGFYVIFSAASDTQGTTLRALVLVRAPAAFLSRSLSSNKAQQYLLHGPHGSGGNVGPLRVVHNDPTNTVWIDSLAVPLKAGNNLLLVEVTSDDSLVVVGQARIEPHIPIPPGPCDDGAVLRRYHQTADTLWARFQALPPVRSFLSR